MVYHIFFVPLKKKTTMSSPYNGLNVEDWKSKTEEFLSSTYKCNFLGADNKQ